MFEILDEKTNMRVMTMPENPNFHLISIKSVSKAVIETREINDDVLFNVTVQTYCTKAELTKIIKLFSKSFYSKNPEINGILIRKDLNLKLEDIGFHMLNYDSDYLYQKNEQKDKVGKVQK